MFSTLPLKTTQGLNGCLLNPVSMVDHLRRLLGSKIMNTFTVCDAFIINGRGTILVPGFKMNNDERIRIGDKVIIKFQNNELVEDQISGISSYSKENVQYCGISIGDCDKNKIIGAIISHIPSEHIVQPRPEKSGYCSTMTDEEKRSYWQKTISTPKQDK